MHRTTGSDFETVGGLPNQHINQNLPGTPGTTADGEFLNAVQEEIKAVLDEAGISIETVAATDRSNGFHQLKDAIFDSLAIDSSAITNGAITNEKISAVTWNKFDYGVMNITEGDYTWRWQDYFFSVVNTTPSVTYPSQSNVMSYNRHQITRNESAITSKQLELSYDEIIMKDETNTTYDVWTATQTTSNLEFLKERDDGNVDLELKADVDDGFFHGVSGSVVLIDHYSKLDHTGLSFNDSGGSVKFMIVPISESSWTGSGSPYTKTTTTVLPITSDILSMNMTIKRASSGMVHTDQDTTLETNYIRASVNGTVFDIDISLNFDPQVLYEDIFVIIAYAD